MDNKLKNSHAIKKIMVVLIICSIILTVIFLIMARVLESNEAVFGKFSYLKIGDEKIPFGIGYGEDFFFLTNKMYKDAIVFYEKNDSYGFDIHLYLDNSIEEAEMNIFYSSSCSSSPCENYKDIGVKIFDGGNNLMTEQLIPDEDSNAEYSIHYQGKKSEVFRVKFYNSIFKSDDQKITVDWIDKKEMDKLKLEYLTNDLSEFVIADFSIVPVRFPANIDIANNTPFLLNDVEVSCNYHYVVDNNSNNINEKKLAFILDRPLEPNTLIEYEYPFSLHEEPISKVNVTSCKVTKVTPVL